MGLRQGMQILDWRDKGARCDERDVLPSPAKVSSRSEFSPEEHTAFFF